MVLQFHLLLFPFFKAFAVIHSYDDDVEMSDSRGYL